MKPEQKARVIEALKWVIVGLENGTLQPMPGSRADMEFEQRKLQRFTMDLQFSTPEGAAATDVTSRPPTQPTTYAVVDAL